jgi:hypothetical protein
MTFWYFCTRKINLSTGRGVHAAAPNCKVNRGKTAEETEMKYSKMVAMLLVTSSPMLISTAHADDGWCGDQLTAVQAAIDGGVYSGRKATSNVSNLSMKLDAADAKLSLHKFDGAVDKLYDISEKATAWADAPKAKLDDATAINYAVADAISCIGSL